MKRLATVTLYSVAMGYLEGALVIYIREMIFGNPIQVFPLRLLQPQLGAMEVGREIATVIMLATVGYLAGRERTERWLFFVYAFAVWDLVYYLTLKSLVGWPPSLLTPDVLFLIPVIWIGPVIAPIMIALLLGGTSMMLLRLGTIGAAVQFRPINIWLFIAGCIPVLYSFTGKIFYILIYRGPKGLENYVPQGFTWLPFFIGYIMMSFAALRALTESYHKMRSQPPDPTGADKKEVIR